MSTRAFAAVITLAGISFMAVSRFFWAFLREVAELQDNQNRPVIIAFSVVAAVALLVGFEMRPPALDQEKHLLNRASVQRHLSEDQKRKLAAGLRRLPKPTQILVVTTESPPEESRYAGDFVEVLQDVGWLPLGPVISTALSPNDRGVMVGLMNPDHPSDLAASFIDVLRGADLDVNTTQWKLIGVGGTLPSMLDFDLFIGPPP